MACIARTQTHSQNHVKSENELPESREKKTDCIMVHGRIQTTELHLIRFFLEIFFILERDMHDPMANIYTGINFQYILHRIFN